MTREEAIKIARACGNNYPWYEGDVRFLEALGLIKFEEEPKYDKTLLSVIHECRSYDLNDEFLDELAKRGYKVVPNG